MLPLHLVFLLSQSSSYYNQELAQRNVKIILLPPVTYLALAPASTSPLPTLTSPLGTEMSASLASGHWTAGAEGSSAVGASVVVVVGLMAGKMPRGTSPPA